MRIESGTGAAIAANLVAIGVGTETDGSISPSSANGLVGIKPTVGWQADRNHSDLTHAGHAGTDDAEVRDAALLLAAMAGVDARDGATSASAGKVPADLIAGLNPNALKGARIGVLRGSFVGYSPASDKVLDAAVTKLKSLGAEVIDPVDLPGAGKSDDRGSRS